MSADGTYNGYSNYQTWNVCLWIANSEWLYNLAARSTDYRNFQENLKQCEESDCPFFQYRSIAFQTPDMVAWNDSGVNLVEMQEFWTENFSKAAA